MIKVVKILARYVSERLTYTFYAKIYIIHENTAFDITGQEALSYGQTAEILSKATGRKISYIDIPPDEAIKAMKEFGIEDWLIADLIGFCDIIKAGNASQTTDTIEQFLGRKATPLNSSLEIILILSTDLSTLKSRCLEFF